MSWEVMRSETAPCECCAGTVTYTFEMDDWNRTRNGREIHCGTCQEKDRLRVEAEHARQITRDSLLEEARRIATERYLERWLKSYASLSKKAIWKRYIGGSGYPALGTFYTHVRHSGSVSKYLESCFRNEFEAILKKLEIRDADVNRLLAERARV